MVALQCILHHLFLELVFLVQDGLDSALAETISINALKGDVGVFCLLAKEVFVTADDRLGAELDVEVLVSILVSESDRVLPS